MPWEQPAQPVPDAGWVTVRPAPTPLPDSQQFVPYVSPRRRARKALRAIAALCILALVAGGGWYAYTKVLVDNGGDSSSSRSPVATTSVGFRSPQAHFVAKFSSRPTTKSTHLTASGHTVEGYLAGVADRNVAVGGFTVRPTLSPKQLHSMLGGIVVGMAHGGKLSRVSERDYQRHPAITATVSSGAAHVLRVLAFAYSASRIYVLIAPTDAALAQLERGFRPIR